MRREVAKTREAFDRRVEAPLVPHLFLPSRPTQHLTHDVRRLRVRIARLRCRLPRRLRVAPRDPRVRPHRWRPSWTRHHAGLLQLRRGEAGESVRSFILMHDYGAIDGRCDGMKGRDRGAGPHGLKTMSTRWVVSPVVARTAPRTAERDRPRLRCNFFVSWFRPVESVPLGEDIRWRCREHMHASRARDGR